MMKKLIFILTLFLGHITYSQNYKYEFAITDIVDAGPAKMAVTHIRDLTGAKIVKFDDEADRFTILTALNFDPLELQNKFQINGIEVVGIITKTNIE